MFKRFLKFFRGEDDAPSEPFEGSYLDHLLGMLRPGVATQLKECPEHDPLLLVVVGILRMTMINAWSPLLRTPLTDTQSPGRSGRLTVRNPAPESVATKEFDIPDPPEEEEDGNETIDEDVLLDEVVSEADEGETGAETQSSDALNVARGADDEDDDDDHDDQADDDDDAPAEIQPAPRSTRKTEEIDVEEVRAASLRATLTDTAEIDRVEADMPDPTIEIEQDTLLNALENADGRPRVDSEEVLQAGRVFLGLLIENDRLPVELQLSVAETTLARDLLLGYFIGNDDFEEKARRLLTLVEQKFGEGLFSQARILLQLFHTDEQTRINNDRNLFYEDMILRLGIRRRHRMSAEELKRFTVLLSDVRTPAGARAVATWLGDVCLIHLQSFNRDPVQIQNWNDLLKLAKRDGAKENFLRYLPPRRWRPVGGASEQSIVERIDKHISIDTAREYVICQIKTCYFVLRAVGDTGLEGFLDTFFDWSTNSFGIDGTVLMPELYKRSMMDPEPMSVILEEIYDKHYAAATLDLLDAFTESQIEAALYDALEAMGACDLGEVAPGYYDLGAFVFDQLFGVAYPTSEFPFKVHRLT